MKAKHIKTHLVFPEDCNHIGTIFGGKLLSIVDLAIAEHCSYLLHISECEDAVTVNFDDVNFHVGAEVGDLIEIHTEIEKIGIKSIKFKFTGYRYIKDYVSSFDKTPETIITGYSTFVTRINKKAAPHNLKDFQ